MSFCCPTDVVILQIVCKVFFWHGHFYQRFNQKNRKMVKIFWFIKGFFRLPSHTADFATRNKTLCRYFE